GAADGEEESKGNEKKVEDAVAEIMAIIELVKEDQRKDVMMAIMKKAKGAGKGKA
ncbi:lon, partial [Symbiodinium necroappetens]